MCRLIKVVLFLFFLEMFKLLQGGFMENLDRLELVNVWKKLKRQEREKRRDIYGNNIFRFDSTHCEELKKVELLLISMYQIEVSELFF